MLCVHRERGAYVRRARRILYYTRAPRMVYGGRGPPCNTYMCCIVGVGAPMVPPPVPDAVMPTMGTSPAVGVLLML